MTTPTVLHDSLGSFRLKDDPAQPISPICIDPTCAVGQPLERLCVILVGGTGKLLGPRLQAYAQQRGLDLRVLYIDDDHQLPEPLMLPNGDTVTCRPDQFLAVGSDNPREVLKQSDRLVRRYVDGGLLRGIPVFQVYPRAGRGAAGHPVIGAIDLDLSAAQVYTTLLSFLRQAVRPGPIGPALTLYERVAQGGAALQPVAARPTTVWIIGGGSGAMGPSGHLLLPGLVRYILTRILHQPEPYQVGAVVGPELYTGYHQRILSNWWATLQQLAYQSHEGLHWAWDNDVTVDLEMPPYDRVVLLDGEPRLDGKPHTETDLHTWAQQMARGLFVAMASDTFDRIEALTVHDRREPWTRLQGVLGQVDWGHMLPLAQASIASARVRSLIPADTAGPAA